MPRVQSVAFTTLNLFSLPKLSHAGHFASHAPTRDVLNGLSVVYTTHRLNPAQSQAQQRRVDILDDQAQVRPRRACEATDSQAQRSAMQARRA
jgi:hypothetical protein